MQERKPAKRAVDEEADDDDSDEDLIRKIVEDRRREGLSDAASETSEQPIPKKLRSKDKAAQKGQLQLDVAARLPTSKRASRTGQSHLDSIASGGSEPIPKKALKDKKKAPVCPAPYVPDPSSSSSTLPSARPPQGSSAIPKKKKMRSSSSTCPRRGHSATHGTSEE